VKRFLTYLKKLVFLLLLVIASYLLVALGLSSISTGAKNTHCSSPEKVYVSSNGVHLFLGIASKDLPSAFIEKLAADRSPRYLYFGWGERSFYLNTPTWGDLTLPVAAKAMLIPSESAMHVMHFENPGASWVPVETCDAQQKKLISFVVNSFADSAQNFTHLEPSGYGPNNYFYKAEGDYSAFYTSNTWVNEALKKAEIPTAVWTPFDFGVLWHLEEDGKAD